MAQEARGCRGDITLSPQSAIWGQCTDSPQGNLEWEEGQSPTLSKPRLREKVQPHPWGV